MGIPDESTIPDYIRQQIKDDLNATLDDIINAVTYPWHLVRESSFATVAGTSTYTLDEDVKRPLSFWVESSQARKLRFIDPRTLDSDGSKNTSASMVYPVQISWYPGTTSAGASGAAGATAGVSITEGSTTVTKTGGTAWTTASHAGKVIRINGEGMDFLVSSVTDSNTLVLNRAYRARLSGIGVTGVGSSLSQVSWEISPTGMYRVLIKPAPAGAETISFRYLKKHGYLLNSDDVPDLPNEFHRVLLAGAIMRNAKYQEDENGHSSYRDEYGQGIAQFVAQDRTEVDATEQVGYESPIATTNIMPYPRDADHGRR